VPQDVKSIGEFDPLRIVETATHGLNETETNSVFGAQKMCCEFEIFMQKKTNEFTI